MLRVSNLTIKYGNRIIINNQDISFEKGKITGIKGKSGAGKSSLLNVLGLIKTPNQECRYWYEGQQIDILDAENSGKIMQLLKQLAHELNKIVIVVSHDEEIISYSDIVYEIMDCQLNLIGGYFKEKNDIEKHNVLSQDKLKQKTIGSFIKKYEKLRRTEYKLNRILIMITTIVVSIASLSVGFGNRFTENQKEFINSISDRSLLVINDTLGLNATADYDDALAFNQETLEFIRGIPNVDKVYPFYRFASYGMAADTDNNAVIRIYESKNEVLVEKEYTNTYLADGNEFYVSPLFEEEKVSNYLSEGTSEQVDNDVVYLSYTMAKDLTENPEELTGKKIEIYCYVPTKLYISKATKPKSKTDIENGVKDETVEIDGYVSKLVKIEKIIGGVLNNSYQNDKYDNNGKIILINYSEMLEIVEKNKDTLDSRTFPGFEEKVLAPSMLVVYAANYDDVKNIENKISNYSSTISVINRSGDIEETRNNLQGIKHTMIMISVTLIIVVTIMFSLLYYFKNRERKREVGVLKALGLSRRNVLMLISVDMLKSTFLTFIFSIFVSIVGKSIINMVLGMEIITVSLASISLSFVISVVTVFVSGMVSVWKTSKIDVIDAIRLNK